VFSFEDTLSMISDTDNPDAPGNIYDRTIQVEFHIETLLVCTLSSRKFTTQDNVFGNMKSDVQ
jgi:hypothetical protein